MLAIISAVVLFTDDYCLDGGLGKVENSCQEFVPVSAEGSYLFWRRYRTCSRLQHFFSPFTLLCENCCGTFVFASGFIFRAELFMVRSFNRGTNANWCPLSSVHCVF